ncbi:hypothetical protein GR255_27270, partial [Mycobacterium tuberculosis]|nr:hypothetical protein [Mycobacterium tuberculosis]
KNQEKVIEAVIKKLTSTSALKNYNEIISGLQDSIQTCWVGLMLKMTKNLPADTAIIISQ